MTPEQPKLETPWIITFMVDHPAPAEVVIRYPPLPASLLLESIRTGARLVESSRWTAVEFWFIPQRPGPVHLRPFEVITPGKRFVTEGISGYIEGTLTEYRPYFSWGAVPPSLAVGEAQELTLRLVNWDPRKPLPGPELLRMDAPEQAILEEAPLSESHREQGIVLRLTIIPLDGQTFALPPATIRHEGLTLEVPEIAIPLKKKKKSIEEKSPEEKIWEEKPPIPPLPETAVQVFPLFRADYEKTLETIRRLWNEGCIPEALAEIRRNERDSLWGHYLVPLRREAERRLGFDAVQDERRRPLFIAIFLGTIVLLLVSLLYTARKKSVTSRFSWGYTSIAVVLAATAGVFGFKAVKPLEGPVTLRTADAYRVPDENSGITARFKGGQSVIIRSASESWAYIETFDGRFGWVLRDKIIVY
jgi:hypothetical protein